MDAKMSTWRPGTAVCRCCLAEGCYKDISTEYFWMGKREVYAEMLTETFDLAISYSQSGGPNSNSRLICEPCISRLRDASEFKRQVYDCEKMFMQHLEPTGSGTVSTEVEIEPINKGVKVETVKEEKEESGDDFFDDRNDFGDDDDDDLDDEPLTKLATKVPKKEKKVDLLDFLEQPAAVKPAAEKRKAPAPPKPKATPVKKVKVVKEAKPSASKDKVVEKKKKEKNEEDVDIALEHARLLLRYSTLYPFKLDCKQMIKCLVCSSDKSKCTFNNPIDFRRHFAENHANFDASAILQTGDIKSTWPRVDITDLRCKKCEDSKIFGSIKTMADHLEQQHDIKVVLELSRLVPIRLEVDRFICVVCDKVTSTLLHLCSHSGIHFSRYICDHCDKSYETRKALISHLNQQHTATMIQCKRCRKVVPTKKALKEHIRSSEICFPHACPICRARFLSYLHREQHLVDVHNKPKKFFPCTECDKVFEKRNALYLHFKATHTDDFKCHLCSKRFDTKRAYTEHTNRHAGIMPFKCPHCTRAFPTEHRFKLHVREHDATNKKKGQETITICPACPYKTLDRYRIKVHVGRTHPEIFEQHYGKDKSKMYCCSVCAYTARVMNRLKLHMKRMHPDVFEMEFGHEDNKMFYCSACAYQNRLKARLKTHVEKEHPEIFAQEFPVDECKMKQCTACPYKNSMRCKLKLHVQRCHPEIYEQEFGNARSRFNYCDACPYKIRGERSLLKLHVKKAHPEIYAKEFKPDEGKMKRCPACPFKNLQRCKLMTHVKKWHPEIFEREFSAVQRKMLACPGCAYQHHQKCRMKLHIKRRHPELEGTATKFGA